MTLKARITLTAILAILLVVVTMIAISGMAQNVAEQRFSEVAINGKSALWNKIINGQMDQLQLATSNLTRDRESIEALKNKNREELEDSVMSTYNRLSTDGVLSNMYIMDISGEILYSSEENISGVTRIPLVHSAIQETKIIRGIARDDRDQLKAMVAFPLFAGRQLVGIGLFIKSLQEAIEDLKKNDKSEDFILNSSGSIEYLTHKELFSSLDLELPAVGEKRLDVAEVDGMTYAVVIQPISDRSGNNPLAHLVSINDMTESYAKQESINIFALMIALLVTGITFAGIYWYIGYSFKPLQTSVTAMERIASGDLTADINVTSDKDETGKLLSAMKTMNQKLHDMIGQITGSTAQLASSTEQVSSIIDESRKGFDKQNSETEQVATAINQMSATVKEVARNAANAAQAAQEANEGAQDGQHVVSQVVDSINELAAEVGNVSDVINRLATDSNDIGVILAVIKGIAEQTNLLALNAAIEAARAGEQGRGFAVVADEVRTLASRTQESTQEIEQMIERLQTGAQQAVQAMESGTQKATASVEQAAKAGESLEAITHAVSTISDMNTQIASAAEEQTAVAEDINHNVVNISQVAEQSTNSIEQIALASKELESLAVGLQSMVNNFKV